MPMTLEIITLDPLTINKVDHIDSLTFKSTKDLEYVFEGLDLNDDLKEQFKYYTILPGHCNFISYLDGQEIKQKIGTKEEKITIKESLLYLESVNIKIVEAFGDK